MNPGLKRVNLRDIAEDSGVSIQTVSRVVRGLAVVAEPTRTRVLESVEKLGYRPNMAARSLSAHRTGQVLVVVSVPLLHGHATTFVEICQELAALGLHAVTSVTPPEKDDPIDLQRLIPVTADGVIVIGGRTSPAPWAAEVAARIPTVIVGRTHELPPQAAGVALDHRRGAHMAVEHLIATGARRIVHVAGPLDWNDASLRRQGYREACAEAGIEPFVLDAGSWDSAAAEPLMAQLPPGADAVFAANDQLALGCMTSLQERGLQIPGDLRIVGFDDMAGAGSLRPALTTVRQDFQRIGALAVEALNDLMNGGGATGVSVEPALIVRSST